MYKPYFFASGLVAQFLSACVAFFRVNFYHAYTVMVNMRQL